MTPTPTQKHDANASTHLSSAPRYPYLPPTFDPDIDWTDLYETVRFTAHLDTSHPIVVARWRGAPFYTLVNLDCPRTYAAMGFGALEFVPVRREDWSDDD